MDNWFPIQILLHKYKVDQLEVISKLLFTWLEHLQFPNTFSCFFHIYGATNLEDIFPMTFRKCTKHTTKMLLKHQSLGLQGSGYHIE